MRCYFLVGENSVIDTTSASSSIRLRLSSIGGRSASKTNGALEVVNGPEHGGSYRYGSHCWHDPKSIGFAGELEPRKPDTVREQPKCNSLVHPSGVDR